MPTDRPNHGEGCCAIVVVYGDPTDAVALVDSLRRHAPGANLVIVENGVEVASPELRSLERGDTVLVAERENAGFGAGCNRGFERAISAFPSSRYFLLINPDAVLTAGAVSELIGSMDRDPDIGVVGGRVLDYEGASCLFEGGRFRRFTLGNSAAAAPPGEEEFETEFVAGTMMLVDGGLVRAGLRFDESYFMYVEDLDFCREVVRRGRKLWMNLRAVCRHRSGGTQGWDTPILPGFRRMQFRQIVRNKAYFARKRLSRLELASVLIVMFVAKPLAACLVYGSVSFLPAYYAALLDGLKMRLPRPSPDP